MRILKNNVLLRLYNSYIVDSPEPANISYLWNFGSLLGVCLIIQILTGCFLAMHYIAHVDMAFNSVEHIMRDVNNGWIIRYTHANVASFFFTFVFVHIARGMYYGSFKTPRVLLWSIGVIIFILMIAIGFMGYVLPNGQMSLWGYPELASNVKLLNNNLFQLWECLVKMYKDINTFINFSNLNAEILDISNLSISTISNLSNVNLSLKKEFTESLKLETVISNNKPKVTRIRADKRIGCHNKIILTIIYGSLLGDGHAERRIKGNGTRITFFQEGSHVSYLLWLHELLSNLGYCSSNLPVIKTRLGQKGVVRKIIRFNSWTFTSLNWIHDLWYINKVKVVPSNIKDYLNPLSLAIWIMDDGGKVSQGLKLSTNCFSYSDCLFLVKILYENFNLKASVQSAGVPDQYIIYIWKESMPLLREIVLPYVHPSMKYKLGN